MQQRPRNKIYNVGLGRLPGKFMGQILGKTISLEYRSHARFSANNDKVPSDKLPSSLTVTEEQVVEIETFKGTLVKFLARLPLDEAHDLCLVIATDGENGVGCVITSYTNDVLDRHETLNVNRIITQ